MLCVKMSLDKKGCVAVSLMPLFTYVDPYYYIKIWEWHEENAQIVLFAL